MQIHGYDAFGCIAITLDGVNWSVPDDLSNGLRQIIAEREAAGFIIAPYIEPPPVVTPAQPVLFASAGVVIAGGAIQTIELAAQLQGSLYEDGWLMIGFATPLSTASYLIFAQTDVPARIEQFKSEGSFELVFSDANGDPVEPGRIDLQILKVR